MQQRPVVCNTSPLIKLVGVGIVEILPKLYNEIWIPESVLQEFQSGSREADPDLTIFPWLIVKTIVTDPSLANSHLGRGEADAISLAETHFARLL